MQNWTNVNGSAWWSIEPYLAYEENPIIYLFIVISKHRKWTVTDTIQ